MVADPAPECPWTCEGFCLWPDCLVDELGRQVAPRCRRRGPAPACTGGEVVTMAPVGECCGWDQEAELVSRRAARRDPFPRQPERSRCNRRRRRRAGAINARRRPVPGAPDPARERTCLLDRLPLPVIRFRLGPAGGRAGWQAVEARFGEVPSKRAAGFGYERYLLATLPGVTLGFAPAPANAPAPPAGTELREEHADPEVLGDQACIGAATAARPRAESRVRRLTLPRRNEQRRVPAAARRALDGARQVAETVNGQPAERFRIETNHARSSWGLCARLYTQLTAHTRCLHLNRLLGAPDPLPIKAPARPRPNQHTGRLGRPIPTGDATRSRGRSPRRVCRRSAIDWRPTHGGRAPPPDGSTAART